MPIVSMAGLAFGAAALAAVAAPLLLWLHRRTQALATESERHAGEAARALRDVRRLNAVLAGSTDGYLAWSFGDGGEFVSDELAAQF